VTTDPGLGPVQREHASTLRSMTAAEPIPEDELLGAAVYCEPKPLHAASEHKTLELETVKLAKDIDPRKLPTELKLRRPVLHVLPASDPNWPAPAPAPQPDVDWPAHFDSNWPPPETTLTTSQPPLAARRSFIPLVLLVLLGATALLVFGARARQRTAAARLAQPVAVAAAASPMDSTPSPSAPASAAREGSAAETAAASATDPAESQAPESAASAQAAEPAPSAAPARLNEVPHHAPFKPASPANVNVNGPAQNAPAAKQQKRAIY